MSLVGWLMLYQVQSLMGPAMGTGEWGWVGLNFLFVFFTRIWKCLGDNVSFGSFCLWD